MTDDAESVAEAGPLKGHMAWLYPDPRRPCICDHAIVSGGRLHGVSMGKTWGRTTTHPNCYHHGTAAQKFYDDNLRRFKKTGDWAEFHVDRDEWERRHSDGPDLGAEYGRRMFAPIELTPEDEDKVADLLQVDDV